MIKTSTNGICDDGKSRVLYKDDDVRSKTVGQFFVKKLNNKSGKMKLVLYKPLDNKRVANKQKGGNFEMVFREITSDETVGSATEFNEYVGYIENGKGWGDFMIVELEPEIRPKMIKYFGSRFTTFVNYVYNVHATYPVRLMSGY